MNTTDGTVVELDESQVRALRANIYGDVTYIAWGKVRENWMKPENVEWLQQQKQNRGTK